MEDWKIMLEIIVPMGAMFGWFMNRFDRRFEAVNKRFDSIEIEIRSVKQDIRSIDGRLSRLEGAFFERGYWESRKTGTEEKK